MIITKWRLNLFDEQGVNVSTTNDTFDTYEKCLAAFQVACDLLYKYPSSIRSCRMNSYAGIIIHNVADYQYWTFRRGFSDEWTFGVHWWAEDAASQYYSYTLNEDQLKQICALYPRSIQIAI
jgi:hypothetical protein